MNNTYNARPTLILSKSSVYTISTGTENKDLAKRYYKSRGKAEYRATQMRNVADKSATIRVVGENNDIWEDTQNKRLYQIKEVGWYVDEQENENTAIDNVNKLLSQLSEKEYETLIHFVKNQILPQENTEKESETTEQPPQHTYSIGTQKVLTITKDDEHYHVIRSTSQALSNNGAYMIIDNGPHHNGEIEFITAEGLKEIYGVLERDLNLLEKTLHYHIVLIR